MSQSYPMTEQALLGRIVDHPAFRRLLDLPLIPWQVLSIVILSYTVIIGGAALYLQGSLPYLLVLLASAFAIYAVFTPLHDATHMAVSRNRTLNDLIGTLAAQAMVPGTTTSLYRYLHLEHHRHTGDPDRDPDECMVSSGPAGRLAYAMFIELKWLQWYLHHLDQRSLQQRIQDLLSLLVYLAWHGVWLASPHALAFVMLWILPQRLGLGIVATLFATIQHPQGVRQSERPLQATRMFRGGPLLRLAMLSQSQHLMHHLFPMLPFYRYNQAWQLAAPLLRDQALVWADLHRPLVQPEPLADSPWIDVTIERVTDISDEIRAYEFAAADGSDLPKFTPGAHIDVQITARLIRQYSLTGLAGPGRYSIAVKREDKGRGGSRTLHQRFAAGGTVRISKPRNLFPMQPDDTHAILMAGGIGITPLLSMAQDRIASGASFEMHVFARNEPSLPFAKHLRQIATNAEIKLWLGQDHGFDSSAMPRFSRGHSLYLCGPAGFMLHIRRLAKTQGWPDHAIYSEAFSNTSRASAPGQAFEVRLARSGKRIEVADGQSLLDALQAHHVPITASCEQGICGTCRCRVLDGEVEHRDRVLTSDQHAQGLMTSCVSRARSGQTLVLDL